MTMVLGILWRIPIRMVLSAAGRPTLSIRIQMVTAWMMERNFDLEWIVRLQIHLILTQMVMGTMILRNIPAKPIQTTIYLTPLVPLPRQHRPQ